MPGVRTGRDLAITIDTRNDLLFTMSDNTYLSPASRDMPTSPSCDETRIVFYGRTELDWWSQTGSNRRPPACKAGALPAELWPQKSISSCLQPAIRRREPRSSEGWWAWEDLNFRPHA